MENQETPGSGSTKAAQADASERALPAEAASAETTTAEASSAEVPPAQAPSAEAVHAFTFTGRASEYFRIWVVNLLLSLVTLGLWSPWAKVRKRRYFYGHTWVADANFEYHGDPVAILRGRLIAVAALGAYWVIDNLIPDAGPVLLLALFLAVPWILTRSLRFNALNSSYRGVRFGFQCKAGDVAVALWPIVLWPVALYLASQDPLAMFGDATMYTAASILVYGILALGYPYVVARVRKLTVGHSSWGRCEFESRLRTRSVYYIYLIGALLGGLVLALVGSVAAGVTFLASRFAGDMANVQAGVVLAFVSFGLSYALGVAIFAGYTRARLTNKVFDTTRFDFVGRFRSTLRARRLMRLYFSNLVVILASCGLMIPWAVIRVARYRAESLSLIAENPIDQVVAVAPGTASATGEELGDAFGFDLAL